MNPETTPTPPASAPAQRSPGAAIRAARTKARLSLEELASRTHLTRSTLEAMENDAYDQLLEPVYVRGYYRKCARVLGLDEAPLIAAYQAAYTPKPTTSPARLRLASGSELGTLQTSSRRLVILAPIAAIAISGAIWIARQEPTPGPGANTVENSLRARLAGARNSDTMPPIDPPAESAPAPAPAPAEAAAPVGTNTAAAANPGANANPSPGAVPAAGTQPTDAAQLTPPPSPAAQLVLTFSAISWARVEDASGKSMLSGVIGASERRVIDGKPPYSVFLGNAPGVKVEFGGQPVDLKPVMKGNSTARFSVPAAAR